MSHLRHRYGRSLPALIATLALGLSGCSEHWPARDPDGVKAQTALERSEQAAALAEEARLNSQRSLEAAQVVERQRATLATMNERLQQLESLLSRHGNGAYRHGPSLTLTGNDGTLLQSLHQLEVLVSQLRQEQAELSTQNQDMRQRLSEMNQVNERLRDDLELLRDADSNLVSLQQERQAMKREKDRLSDRLTTSEVERLRSERRYFDLVREIITLKSDETTRLIGLQSRLRGEVSVMRPVDLVDEANDADQTDLPAR